MFFCPSSDPSGYPWTGVEFCSCTRFVTGMSDSKSGCDDLKFLKLEKGKRRWDSLSIYEDINDEYNVKR